MTLVNTAPVDKLGGAFNLRLLADSLPQMIGIADAAGGTDYLNQRWCDYVGISALLASRMDWLASVHPDDLTGLSASWRQALADTQFLRSEFRLSRYDAGYRWCEAQLSPLRDSAGELRNWFICVTDIHEVVEQRQRLLAADSSFRILFERAPVPLLLLDWRSIATDLAQLRLLGLPDYQQYFETHSELVAHLFKSLRLLDANNDALKLFGCERLEQLQALHNSRVAMQPLADANFVKDLNCFLKGENVPATEIQAYALDGTPRYLMSSIAELSPATNPGIMLGSCVNITAARQANQQLEQQRSLLERVGDLAKVGGWMIDLQTSVDTVTAEVWKICGLNDAARTASDFISLLVEVDRERLQLALQRIVDQAEPYDLELQLVTPAKESKWVRTQGVPVLEHGRVVRIEGALQDITDRKLSQLQVQALNASLEHQVLERTAQLERMRQHLQNTLDALPMQIGYWDGELRLRFANRRYQQLVAVDGASLVGRRFSELVPAFMLAERQARMNLALQGELQIFESPFVTRDGRFLFHAQTYYQPDIVAGAVLGVYVLVIDTTSLKQAEDALHAANRELESFAYAVAHDLRAPLRAMSGFSHALLEDYGATLPEDAREFALEIDAASRRMGKLIDGLLLMSRSTQGEMQYDPINLSAMAATLLVELQMQEPQRQVHWQVQPELVTYGDARMVELVLRNLLSNAWKYTSRVSAAEITVSREQHDNVWQFVVSDNGAGFDMTHIDRLFKPFQRLHRQDEFPGIGVGLATVNRIVHRHGGEIGAESAPGQGARFYFNLGQRCNVEPA